MGGVRDDGMVCSVAVIYDRYSSCMKPHRLHRNQFVSLGDITLEQLASLGPPHKHSSTFVTQKTIAFEDEIRQHHYELNRYLDRLDEKVTGVIQHNQGEIFTAFKNHFARVKKDLEEFKKHSEAQANSSNTFLEKIEALEKQLAVFREESLKLFSKLTEREKTIEHMRMNMQELLSEKRHMDGVVKELSKRNRELQSQKDKYEERKHSETDNMTLQINSFTKNFITKNRLRERSAMQSIRPASNMSNAKRSANHTISVDQTFHQFTESDAIGKYLRQRLPSLDEKTLQAVREVVAEYMGQEERKRARQARSAHFQKDKERYDKNQTRMTNRSRSIYTADPDPTKRSIEYTINNDRSKQACKYKSQQFTNTLQLSQYFKKCIEIVRKEIGMRRKVNTVSFYREGAPIGIDEFKKTDFIQLMELVCSHEPIILALYGMLVDSGK